MIESVVASMVIEVEAFARWGIFNNELFIIIKLILEKTANSIATINFQLVISENILPKLNRFPEISPLSPTRVIDIALTIQYIISQNIKATILILCFGKDK